MLIAATRAICILCGLSGGLALLACGKSAGLDLRMTGWNHPRLAATRDTPYGRVSVRQRTGQVALFAGRLLLPLFILPLSGPRCRR